MGTSNNGGHVVGNPRSASKSIAGEVKVKVKPGVKKPPKKQTKKKR
jgi:hypothetical protein